LQRWIFVCCIVCCSVCCSVLQCVLQCVAVCCSWLQSLSVVGHAIGYCRQRWFFCVAVCVAVWCSVMHFVAVTLFCRACHRLLRASLNFCVLQRVLQWVLQCVAVTHFGRARHRQLRATLNSQPRCPPPKLAGRFSKTKSCWHMGDVTHSYVWRDSCASITWLICMSVVICWYVW